MPNEQWQQRVARAQQMAAERLGIEVGIMLPPRQPSEGGAVQEAEAQVEAVAESTPEPVLAGQGAGQGAGSEAAVITDPPPSTTAAAAQRIAEAKARAASKAQANGGGVTAAAVPQVARPAAAPKAAPAVEEEAGQEGINRREFLTYAWGAALGLLTLGGGYATYEFLYPRFRAGEFGGKFIHGLAAELPNVSAPPVAEASGKYWMVDTDGGPKALYMVCTHLGCLYKWEPSTFRFECPCHGSKFTAEGDYIEGPAARSLDQFVVEIVENGEIVAQTEETSEAILAPAVPGEDAQIVVDTGSRILGKPAATSPALGDV